MFPSVLRVVHSAGHNILSSAPTESGNDHLASAHKAKPTLWHQRQRVLCGVPRLTSLLDPAFTNDDQSVNGLTTGSA